jgi:transposase
MSATRSRRRCRTRSRSRRQDVIQKPAGTIHPRVQKVGPQHFGIVSMDCAKKRTKWMLTDFFGNVLLPPTPVEHNRPGFDAAIARLRQAIHKHDLRDLIVAIERTGRYHHAPKRAFADAGFEVRIVHPFITCRFRQSRDPDNKTDDNDLAAIGAAAINGFALLEQPLDENWQTLQLVIRHRRDLVQKNTIVCCQIREHLDAAYPGLAACFSKLWESDCAWHLIGQFASAQHLLDAGLQGLSRSLDRAGIQFHRRTLVNVLDWAEQAAAADLGAAQHRTIALALNEDRLHKTQEILALERQSAGLLAGTPYILLLSFPGVNVVSAADYAGEMGPIEHYANARAITGRAGLCPSRYQSDEVDNSGPLRKRCNRRLRAVLMGIADNLVLCNDHFIGLAKAWRQQGKDAGGTRVKVALRFARISFQMVAGGQVFRHPGVQGRHYILDKLNVFHREHQTAMADVMRDLKAAVEHLPRAEQAAEAAPLAEELEKIKAGRRYGPQPLADILPIVLARLGVVPLESKKSGEKDLR